MRASKLALGVALAAGGIVGAHTIVAHVAACPVREPTAAELEGQRVRAMVALAGSAKAPSAQVMPDTILGETTRERFVARAGAAGARCSEELDGMSVRCELGANDARRDEVVARFDLKGRLVGLDHVRYGLSGRGAEATLSHVIEDATARFGDPSRRWGSIEGAYLAAPLRQAGAAWSFADLTIEVTATQLGREGENVVLREQHRAIPKQEDSRIVRTRRGT